MASSLIFFIEVVAASRFAHTWQLILEPYSTLIINLVFRVSFRNSVRVKFRIRDRVYNIKQAILPGKLLLF